MVSLSRNGIEFWECVNENRDTGWHWSLHMYESDGTLECKHSNALLKTAATCRHWATTRAVQDRHTDTDTLSRFAWETDENAANLFAPAAPATGGLTQSPTKTGWPLQVRRQTRQVEFKVTIERNVTEKAFCRFGAFYLEGVWKPILNCFSIKDFWLQWKTNTAMYFFSKCVSWAGVAE